jgi:hypothetical protein
MQLNMTSLAVRRKMIDVSFLHKKLNGFIKSLELLSCLNFNVPYCRTKPAKMFYIPLQRTNYELGLPIDW